LYDAYLLLLLLLALLLLLQLTKNFTSVCVTDTGAVGGVLLGVVTTRDVDFVNDRATPLEEVMTR
jgi:IMP dehydrogenase